MKTIGINIGCNYTSAYIEGQGVEIREPNAVAIEAVSNEPVAIGHEAVALYNKTPGAIELITDLYQGNISDYDRMAMMLEHIFDKADVRRPEVIFAANAVHSTQDKEALARIMVDAGAKKVSMVSLPTAAVMGAGAPLNDMREVMVCDIGSAYTEIGIVKGCATKMSRTLKYGGNKLEKAIMAYIGNEYHAVITNQTAMAIRGNIGSVHPAIDRGNFKFTARDMLTGMPCELSVTCSEIRDAIKPFADYLVANLEAILKKLPDHVMANIRQRGIMLSGEGSRDGGIKELIEDATGISVDVSDNPEDCVIEGIGMIIENRKVFDALLNDPEDE